MFGMAALRGGPNCGHSRIEYYRKTWDILPLRASNVMETLTSALQLPPQPVDATQALNLSAGVSNCKVSRGRSFILACHLGQHHVTRLTLDQGRDVGVVRPGQQIALLTARHRPIFNRRRSLTD